MKKIFLLAFGVITFFALNSCNSRSSKPDPESRNYESGFNSSSTATDSEEDNPYIDCSLSTGEQPYDCSNLRGDKSSIEVRTSSSS